MSSMRHATEGLVGFACNSGFGAGHAGLSAAWLTAASDVTRMGISPFGFL